MFDFDVPLDSVEQNVAAARGEICPAICTGLPTVDLAAFPADSNFEAPGLHKRVRAGLGNLLARSGDNVFFEWKQCHIAGDPEYGDYDRAYLGEFSSEGSSWGSSRGTIVRVVWAKHISNSRTISDEVRYLNGVGLYGMATDSNGAPGVAFRLFIPSDRYERDELHPEVQTLWDGLIARATDEIMEDLVRHR